MLYLYGDNAAIDNASSGRTSIRKRDKVISGATHFSLPTLIRCAPLALFEVFRAYLQSSEWPSVLKHLSTLLQIFHR